MTDASGSHELPRFLRSELIVPEGTHVSATGFGPGVHVSPGVRKNAPVLPGKRCELALQTPLGVFSRGFR